MIFRAAVGVAVYLFLRWIADCDAQGIAVLDTKSLEFAFLDILVFLCRAL